MCLRVCFFLASLGAGEMTIPSESNFDAGAYLTYADIAVDSVADPNMLRVWIKTSKTDPFRKGIDVILGRTLIQQGQESQQQ